jgi:tetratricopeptide (TPR) repeat protein
VAAQAGPTAGRRLLATTLGVVPGLAHVLLLERTGTGTLLFLLFLAGAQAAAWGRYLVEAEWSSDLFQAGCAAAALAWLVSFLDVARLVLFRNHARRAALRARLADEGVRHYAAGRLVKARAAFREALELDLRDPDILFWYACVEARRGRVKRALRSLRRCRKYDRTGKWAFLVGREEARLRGPSAGASGG